jgi:hypothetical protein
MKVYVIESPRFPHTHTGVMLTPPVGDPIVYANCPSKGLVRGSLANFRSGQPLRVVREVNVPMHEALRRIQMVSARPYDVFNWNCEHFVAWVEGREPSSPQVQLCVALATVAAIAWAGSRARA